MLRLPLDPLSCGWSDDTWGKWRPLMWQQPAISKCKLTWLEDKWIVPFKHRTEKRTWDWSVVTSLRKCVYPSGVMRTGPYRCASSGSGLHTQNGRDSTRSTLLTFKCEHRKCSVCYLTPLSRESNQGLHYSPNLLHVWIRVFDSFLPKCSNIRKSTNPTLKIQSTSLAKRLAFANLPLLRLKCIAPPPIVSTNMWPKFLLITTFTII